MTCAGAREPSTRRACAAAIGLPSSCRIARRHAIAVLGTMLLGAVVVEQVFALPGLGSMLTTAIAQHDYPSIQGVLLVSTTLVLVIGFRRGRPAARH